LLPFSSSAPHRHLPSFPTRRSSDLVWGLFTRPDQEWQEIRGEEESISHMYLTHVLLLAAIPAVSAYIGTTQVGWAIGNRAPVMLDRKSTRLNSSHVKISYAVFCLKK